MLSTNENLPIVYGLWCTVISPNKRVLLLKRQRNKEVFPNVWAVVGAYPFREKIDMQEAAQVEVKDETGLECKVLKIGDEFIKIIELDGRQTELHVIPILASVDSENVVLNDEHTEYKWLNLENVFDYELAPDADKALSGVHIKEHLAEI